MHVIQNFVLSKLKYIYIFHCIIACIYTIEQVHVLVRALYCSISALLMIKICSIPMDKIRRYHVFILLLTIFICRETAWNLIWIVNKDCRNFFFSHWAITMLFIIFSLIKIYCLFIDLFMLKNCHLDLHVGPQEKCVICVDDIIEMDIIWKCNRCVCICHSNCFLKWHEVQDSCPCCRKQIYLME